MSLLGDQVCTNDFWIFCHPKLTILFILLLHLNENWLRQWKEFGSKEFHYSLTFATNFHKIPGKLIYQYLQLLSDHFLYRCILKSRWRICCTVVLLNCREAACFLKNHVGLFVLLLRHSPLFLLTIFLNSGGLIFSGLYVFQDLNIRMLMVFLAATYCVPI